MSGVELQRFQYNSQTSWNSHNSSNNNPAYRSFESDAVIDPTSNDRMYDIVSGEKPAPPPLPGTRQTTSNTLYASRGDTIQHPNAATTLDVQAPPYSPDGLEADAEYVSSKCLRITCLSILVVVSLFLAIVAVVLVMLLWFGVYVPNAATVTVCPNTVSVQPVVGTVSLVPSPTETCSCQIPNITPIVELIEEEAANLTVLIRELDNEIYAFVNQSNANDQILLNQASTINSSVNQINSSCIEALANISSQNASIGGLNFNAELRGVGVYSNCVFEYLDICEMNLTTFECVTSYHDILFDGYYNIDLACHIRVIPIQQGGVSYAPLTNLRFSAKQNQSIANDDTADAIFAKSEMRCECNLISLTGSPLTRRNQIDCMLFRTRCPTVNNFNVTIVTP